MTVGIREDSGHVVGSESTGGVDLRPERLEPVRLHLPAPPFRDGRFFVDVRVQSHDRETELAFAERALELSFFSRDSGGAGPVRLGGSWELPAAETDATTELPTAERA